MANPRADRTIISVDAIPFVRFEVRFININLKLEELRILTIDGTSAARTNDAARVRPCTLRLFSQSSAHEMWRFITLLDAMIIKL